jgi:predicted nucleic-acid-binding protein
MYALDTNVLVRYIVQDDDATEQVQKATQAIERLVIDDPAFISCIVLCEMNWVLRTAYKISKEGRIAALRKILSVAAFHIERLECCTKALKRYEKGKADFSDYLIQEIARQEGYDTVLTFDTEAQQDTGFRLP